MKKIIALILVLALSSVALIACGNKNGENSKNDYSLALAVETTIKDSTVTHYAVALVLDGNSKVVAARLDCVEATVNVTDGAIADADVSSKVELGDNYAMKGGSFAKQTKAFEAAVVGKTKDEVTNLDMALVSGCTMPSSPAAFKAVIAKAFANAR